MKLFRYQEEGAQWLTTKNYALLADEPGLGKSAQVIVAAHRIGVQQIHVICPANVVPNWHREFEKWRKYASVSIPSTLRARSYNSLTTLESFSTTSGNLRELLIVDESHYCKSITAKRTQRFFGQLGLVHAYQRVWCLSGTPCPNHTGELYPLVKAFGLWDGSYADFERRYCTTRATRFGTTITGNRNIPEIRSKLDEIMLRRKKVDVLKDLPALMITDLAVEPAQIDEERFFPQYYITKQEGFLHEKLRKERDAMTAMALDEALDDEDSARGDLSVMESMAKSVSTLRKYIGLQKVPAVLELLQDELGNNAYHKIVVFAIHKDVVESLREGLRAFNPVTLYGGTAQIRRQENIDRFIKDPRCRVFIGNIGAAGTGIDGLQRVCDRAIFVEQDWVPSNNAQAAMRLHRIGQTLPVHVRVVGVADSIDEQVARTLRRKMQIIMEVLG